MTRLAALLLGFASLALVAKADGAWTIANVRVFDGERVNENVSVTICSGEITEITHGGSPPPDATIVDGTGRTLIPGLINAHVHVYDTPDQSAEEQLQETAQAGVLTVLDLFSRVEPAARLRTQRNTTGQADHFSAGACATPPDGHGTQYGFPTPTLSSPEEAAGWVDARLEEGSDFIKIILEDADGRAERLSDVTVAAVIERSRQRGAVSVVHVSHASDALVAFDAGANGLAHLWFRDTAPAEDEIVARLGTRPFFVTPTLVLSERMDPRFLRTAPMDMSLYTQEAKRLHDAGVTLLAGTDSPNFGVNAGTDMWRELELLVEGGLTPVEALAAATANVADAYGLNDRGRIAAGKRADLILVNGDPAAEVSALREVEMIWQMGEVIRANGEDH